MYLLVLCTCPDNSVAELIGRALVEDKLAACVNIMPGITSVYRWQGNVEFAAEVQLLIKTASDKYPLLEEKINSLHPYETPEIIALNIQQGDKHYLNWITESLKENS
ncbi:divalent-cation tolerance protein CutA [Thalassomonas haliotis]|uniref:Divalent-cation tolerance protein CutA n=1 Tax=Thalassomonas haliotis TaxID=485448 RepID=A0ABY7VBJ5_9GAMM|nr:divalent-cation tolerance protein CutA [Thalassomonas haliotis]WDE11013.1 divalent-cation tolerance protein CutA [Thalassomonas haliotis]